MFENSRRVNREYTEFLERKNAEMVDRLNSRTKDVDVRLIVWLARAFAFIALIVGLGYIVVFVVKIL